MLIEITIIYHETRDHIKHKILHKLNLGRKVLVVNSYVVDFICYSFRIRITLVGLVKKILGPLIKEKGGRATICRKIGEDELISPNKDVNLMSL